MKVLWFPRLQFDTDRMHITTWREMCREMTAAGHQVRIAVAGNNPNGDFKGVLVPVHIIPVKFLRIISFWINGFLQFLLAVGRFMPDAVILDVFTCWFSLPLLLIPRRFRPALLIDNRTPVYIREYYQGIGSTLMRYYTRLCFTYCAAFLDGMTVITDYYKDYVIKRYGFPGDKIAVWGSGVNTRVFDPAQFAGRVRPESLRGKFVLMQHGEISHARGMFQTIEALNLIGKDDICLLLMGDVVRSGKEREQIFGEIRERDRGKRVVIFPPVKNTQVPEFIQYCDCAVLPYPRIEYWNNNNPIKLIEYLAMAKPVICTDMWTFRSVMGSSSCAVYVRDNTPAVIAQAIERCYRDRAKLPAWGLEGRAIAEQRYSWEKQAGKLSSFIEDLQGRKHRKRRV